MDQLEGAGAAYNEMVVHRLRGPLDTAVLARALDAVAARHDVLRARMVTVDGEVYQVAGPADAGYPLVTVDLSGEADPEARLVEVQRAEAEAPFELGVGPLARGRLVRLGAEDHALLLTMHHIAFDGASMVVMMREVGALYAAFLGGAEVPLETLELQYADHARRQREWAAGPECAAQGAYWQEQLAGAPPLLEVPADRPRPPEQDHRGGRVALRVDAEVTAALSRLARRQNSSTG
ncbi:condensation domain-containing protein [Streptomyces sp. NPDC056149]|uniref:condensation domain-containing protein n=1 Tax=Streptomyces sp. NPDC056149 TaxID=3345728 RepID=UPI0035D8935C